MGNVEKMSKGIQFPNIECQLVLFLDLTLNTVFDHINCRDVALLGRVWRIGRVDTFRPKGHWFDSRLTRHLGTMGKSVTHNCLWRSSVKFGNSIRAVFGAPLSSGGLEDAL